MPDSARLTILKALTGVLEEITEANGYQHDLAGKVVRGRLSLGADDKLPLLAINEKPVFPEQLQPPRGGTSQVVKLELLIQGFAEDDPRNPTDPAYLLLADVQKRLGEEKARDDGYDLLRLNHRVSDLRVGEGVVRPPDSVISDTAFFWLPLTLEFGEKLNDPFA